MTDKDPKDMTASDLLRNTASSIETHQRSLEYLNMADSINLLREMFCVVENETSYSIDLANTLVAIADKIDAELSEARKDAIRESKKPMWWFRAAISQGEDWAEPQEGESFRHYLDRCFLPRPRFEDGEPVQFGDDIALADGSECNVTSLGVGISGWIYINPAAANERYHLTCQSGRIKRPAPDVLGADGLPLKVGEVVYSAWYGRRNPPITSVHKAGDTIDGFPAELDFVRYEDGYDWAKDLTHTPPETQERIDEDASLPPREYYVRHIGHDVAEKGAVEVHAAVTAHLLKRQREIDAKGAI